MSDLSAKFTTLEEQLATQNALLAGYIDTVEPKLQAILDFLDIMNENNAANTKALLAAMGQTGACFPCPTPSVVVPPIGTTPSPINSERCQRAQAIIATIHNILAAMDTMQSFNVIGTFNVVNDAISEIIGGIVAGDTVPLPSFPETVNIVGDYVSYAGERLFSGIGLVEQFAPLESTLLTAIAGQTTAEDSRTQYDSVIDGADISNGARLLFKAVAYTALWTYFFDPASTPDLSGFDGSICGFVECIEGESTTGVTTGSSAALSAIVWPEPFNATNFGGFSTWSANAVCTDNLAGYTIVCSTAVHIYQNFGSGTHADIVAGELFTFGVSDAVVVYSDVNSPFTFTICPPGE